jgi:hypothetical protein
MSDWVESKALMYGHKGKIVGSTSAKMYYEAYKMAVGYAPDATPHVSGLAGEASSLFRT